MSTRPLSVSALTRNDCAVIAFVGDVVAPQPVREVLAAITHDGPGRLVVDLSHVDYMVTAAIRVLVSVQDDLIGRRATMALACPRPLVAKLLDLAGADQRIPVYYDLGEAVRGHVAVR